MKMFDSVLSLQKLVMLGLLLGISQVCLSQERLGIQFYIDNDAALQANMATNGNATLDQQIAALEMHYIMMTAQVNNIYRNSGVNLELEHVNTVSGDFTDSGIIVDADTLHDDIDGRDGGNTGVADRIQNVIGNARSSGADYTILVVHDLSVAGNDICGSAFDIGGNAAEVSDLASSIAVMDVSDLSCDESTLAHELGHLMGLVHGDYAAATLNSTAHIVGRFNNLNIAKGWAIGNGNGTFDAGEFATVMVGNIFPNFEGGLTTSDTLPLFSNPRLINNLCGNVTPRRCGDFQNGDSVALINQNVDLYGGHVAGEPGNSPVILFQGSLPLQGNDAPRFVTFSVGDQSCTTQIVQRNRASVVARCTIDFSGSTGRHAVQYAVESGSHYADFYFSETDCNGSDSSCDVDVDGSSLVHKVGFEIEPEDDGDDE